MSWLTELRVGIEYVCKLVQCLFLWWIVDKNKNKNKWEQIDEINILKIKSGKKWIINILMYVNNFWWEPYLLKELDLFSQKIVISLNK